MASKFQFITELYRATLAELTGDYESWAGFLRAACYNYKCPFDEQVLIYAQRPNATAVLELEKWNRQFGRWVNAGATGIAVIDEAHGKGRLKHYFDITDTHATRISRPVPIWSMEPVYTEPVIETLEATFGILAEKDNLPDAILSASRNAVADNMPDYLRDLLDCRDGSMLEELDALNVEVTYRRALESSVAYMLMTRLSLPAMAYLLPEDFEGTVRSHRPAERVDTAVEALALSIGEKARVDMAYMGKLTGKDEDTLFMDLQGVVFLNPDYEEKGGEKYLPADEYLPGNVRRKLAEVRTKAETEPQYLSNVEALEKVQPVDLTASEISVRLGATWLNPEYIRQFIFEALDTPRRVRWDIKVHYSQITGEWRIEGKSKDKSNIKSFNTYGTLRASAYEIIESSLNLKDVRIFDYQYDTDGRRVAVLNKKETAIAQGKQELLKEAFAEWIWKDPERREKICKAYNILFNSNRPREYDGSHINFSGMNPEITLRKHQVNAIAHILYGGNTLLAHVVGAGKTFEMVAAAMESKRLGLCQKSLFVVPNHLTEQWASEFLQLYPAANVLVATKKDFETKNRKKFCGRIATGDYDAVIIGHSQFEKIPVSIQRQRAILEQQMDEIILGIQEAKNAHAENFTIKQMEKTRKGLQNKLDKLNDQSRKDDVVTFEELGVDRLFIDESHYYKNLFLYTKMRNVSGIAQTEAQKSSDLFMKCRYLDEITGGRGVVFATGTPISNSMVELYTIQRYLQMEALQEQGFQHFDAWAANYGETVTTIELAPEGYNLVGR